MSENHKSMFAGVVYGKEDIRYEQVPFPIPKNKEVIVKVKYTGVCGSDVPRVNNGTCHFFPTILGHEFSGVIVETGKDVSSIERGMRVAGVPLVPCMKCEDCQRGNFSLCKHYSFIGSRQNGSFAEYVAVPEQNVVPFSNDTSFQEGSFFEPATVALHGIECASYKGGKTVAILGAGTIGLLTLQWIKNLGASKIVVVNRSKEKLVLAQTLGADEVISTLDSGSREALMGITGNRGFDYVFETAGSTEMIKEAFYIAANKATVCCIGTPTTQLSFEVKEWELLNRKEMYLTGSWMSYSAPFPGPQWELTAQYFDMGRLRIVDEMIDTIIPLSDIAQAFKRYKQGGVKGKLLIDSEK